MDKEPVEIEQSKVIDTFDISNIPVTEHEYIQRGSEIVCTKPGHRHAQQIDPRLTLQQKDDGSYVLGRV